jgi:predicted ribosome quality control (RQC) complex YloA/Tae2 family protein
VLVHRLGRELEFRLRGSRVTEAGFLSDGRIAVALRGRGSTVLLAIDAFASPPAVTVEPGELATAAEPGFGRALAAALRGTVLSGVRSRIGDRLLRLTFSTRSRFGVGDETELYLELVPRFGNVVLVRREKVVAAAKEFTLAQNGRRAVGAGLAYALPPLPAGGSLVPKLVAQSGVDPDAFLVFAQSDAAMRDALYVYRRDELVLQAHVVPLCGFAGAASTREASLLDVMAEVRTQEVGRDDRERAARRRRAVSKRLGERERKLLDELAALAVKRARVAERDGLRQQGEQILGTLHEVPETQRRQAKERAAELFATYKKLGAALPHVARREHDVRTALDAVEALRWEAERVASEDLDDLEAALGILDGRSRRAKVLRGTLPRKRKRSLLEFQTASGSRIVVGRSPGENAEVTFKIARPDDLWFHAQGVPGAHVILSRNDRRRPSPEDIETAASLAAHYSKAKTSLKVAVDYTQRKYVRKQRDAPPGLVWYTNPRTVVTAPRDSVAP